MGSRKKKGVAAPKIPAYKFSLRNKSDAAYKDRLRVLKGKFGAKFSFASNAKLTPQRKGAITRIARKFTEFLNPKNRFEFVKATPGQLKQVKRKKQTSREQITTKGIFVSVPKKNRTGKKTKIRLTREGTIETRTGSFSSHFERYPSIDVATNPELIAERAKELRAETVYVSIKGHRGKRAYSLKAFMAYMKHVIIPDIEEAQEDEEKNTAFRNWFGVEYVTHDWKTSKHHARTQRKGNKR